MESDEDTKNRLSPIQMKAANQHLRDKSYIKNIKKRVFNKGLHTLMADFTGQDQSMISIYKCEDTMKSVQDFLNLKKNIIFYHIPNLSISQK